MRTLLFAVLAASLLAGCGGAPVTPLTKQASGTVATASGQHQAFKVQILGATQRQDQANAMRLVIQYRVTPAGGASILRQVIIDSQPTRDRVVYRSGFRPVQIVLNGVDALQNDETLLMLLREHEALAYHTITTEQAQLVSLATQILYDRIH